MPLCLLSASCFSCTFSYGAVLSPSCLFTQSSLPASSPKPACITARALIACETPLECIPLPICHAAVCNCITQLHKRRADEQGMLELQQAAPTRSDCAELRGRQQGKQGGQVGGPQVEANTHASPNSLRDQSVAVARALVCRREATHTMKVLAALSLLLLACSVRAQECPNAAQALAGFPEISDIATLIEGFDLLPYGVPEGATIFLPDNAAVAELVTMVQPLLGGANLTVAELPGAVMASPLASLAVPKLTSALLYHFALDAAWTPEELATAGTIPTALEGYTLTFKADNSTGAYTVTDGTGGVANVLGEPLSACGSELYVIDRVLLPAKLPSIPDTTPEQAVAILGGNSTAVAPSPAA
ncbi:hypothetical protein ABPG75_010988 [Micractinium tetrahymenae]